ncbi:S-locus-specific glycoprotein BS29-2 [Hordeum vulgare]|nr:S-locus-specific glycoprotein BS29-2 [Hordeum vulgare]
MSRIPHPPLLHRAHATPPLLCHRGRTPPPLPHPVPLHRARVPPPLLRHRSRSPAATPVHRHLSRATAPEPRSALPPDLAQIADCIPQSSAMTVSLVDLYTLKQATLNFFETHVIGQGGFGIVYKGQLPDGRTIAVKRLRQSARTRKGKCDFTREVEVIVRLRHGNLVRLLAYCNEGDERILVYVYMPNKSLDLYIFGEPSLRATLSCRY